MNNSADQAKLSGNPDESSLIPLSEYAKKLELRVKQYCLVRVMRRPQRRQHLYFINTLSEKSDFRSCQVRFDDR